MKRWYIGAMVLLAAAVASAMSIHEDTHELARSDDGKTRLMEVRSAGPEGGGGLEYRLVGPSGSERFEISSTFSPGDASTPQGITTAACKVALARLAKATAKWKAGVVVHVEICDRDQDRSGAVTTKSRQVPRAK